MKALILGSGTKISEEHEIAGDVGGEGEFERENLGEDERDRSRASSFGSALIGI